MKPGFPPQHVNYCLARSVTYGCTFHSSFPAVLPLVPLRSTSFPVHPSFLCHLSVLAHASTSLCPSLSLFPREYVCECSQQWCDITPGFPLLHYLSVSFPLPFAVISHQSLLQGVCFCRALFSLFNHIVLTTPSSLSPSTSPLLSPSTPSQQNNEMQMLVRAR